MNRNIFLKLLSGSLLTPFIAPGYKENNADIVCEKTGPDVSGPFFRKDAPWRTELALGANGEKIKVFGVVTDSQNSCKPLEGVVIDIWHASPEGEYDTKTDRYQFRGKMKTNSEGQYEFNTVMPAGYRDGELDRPKHIHYKLATEDGRELITQLYFKGDERMKGDRFVEQNNGYERAAEVQIVNDKLKSLRFDIVI